MKLLEKIRQNGVYTIAELSVNHADDLEIAKKAVHLAAEAGADCLKTQYFTGNSITMDCENEYFSLSGGEYRNYYEFYEALKMPVEWQPILKAECEACGIDFLCTPTDRETAVYLDSIGMEFFKVAAFELNDLPLLRVLGGFRKPVILSCGMASIEEIEDAIEALRQGGTNDIILLKCTSEYPAPFEELNLSLIPDMISRFGLPVGFSDHTPGPFAPPFAVALGACVVEKHFCIGRQPVTAESHFSMTPEEFRVMVDDIAKVKVMMGHGRYDLTPNEEDAKSSRRSLFASANIKKGELFTEKNVKSVRPSYGLSPKLLPALLASCASRDIAFGEPLSPQLMQKPNK